MISLEILPFRHGLANGNVPQLLGPMEMCHWALWRGKRKMALGKMEGELTYNSEG